MSINQQRHHQCYQRHMQQQQQEQQQRQPNSLSNFKYPKKKSTNCHYKSRQHLIWLTFYLVLQLFVVKNVVVVYAAVIVNDIKVIPSPTISATVVTTTTTTTLIAEAPTLLSSSVLPSALPTMATTNPTFIKSNHSNNNNNINYTRNITATTTNSAISNNNNNKINNKQNNIYNHRNGDVLHHGFSALNKEVVERLIKEWAPVVWLAPQEKFMPLGVDEFLNHVHPTDKGKTFIPGMPIGDTSEKTYLVTNAEIEELLENENSFIFGRNPNESPVPIYAVVSLCSDTTPPHTATHQPNEIVNKMGMAAPTGQALPPALLQQQQHQQYYQHLPQTLHQVIVPSSTRGPYIPVSIDPLDERNNTVRRSSRLYPVFNRIRRDLMPHTTAEAAYSIQQVPPPSTLDLLNKAQKPIITNFDLVMGETKFDSINTAGSTAEGAATATDIPAQDNSAPLYNNFIANLADNVKFSAEFENSINIDSSFNQQIHPGFEDLQVNGISSGQKIPSFHVTYWMFYPYSQGKTMCTLSLGPLGHIPFPAVYGFCLGRRKDIGSHIGDWEHMSLYFNDAAEPEAMYVSAHDAGAYYTYNRLTGSFEFKKQETRKGILQRPNFPKTVTTFNNHPVLFAAKGSHGLWTAPGKHRFVKVARLYDVNGFGTPWNTWKAVEITYENLKSYGRSLIPSWLSFKGKWGNPKSKCHPFRRIGLNFCEYTDGPTGIPLKEPHFQCGATYRR